jgi:protein TonB
VTVTVAADGRITNAAIQQSSGFPRLDEACLKGVKDQRMKPATEDGKPVETTAALPIVWKLTNKYETTLRLWCESRLLLRLI